MDAEKAWESLTLADHKRLSDAFLAGGAEAGARFLGKEAFLLGWQKATERAAKIVEDTLFNSALKMNKLADKIRQQESE